MLQGSIASWLCLAGGIALGAACLLAQGPLPGDLPLTRALQRALGTSPSWAEFVTSTAKAPAVWLTVLLAAALAGASAGWRGAAVPVLGFGGIQLLDPLLRALVFTPKPSPELVAVAAESASSGFPSTFALVYGALFGAVLFVTGGRAGGRALALVASATLLVAGVGARIVLGGHWGSQMLASLLVAFALVLALRQVLGPGQAAGALARREEATPSS